MMNDPEITDQQLSSVLHQIAEKRVTEELDMWPELQDQINKLPHQRAFTRRSARMTFLLAAVLLVSVAAYAFDYLGQPDTDPGLDAAGVTEINETQTVGNGTATLFYAYADANRLSLSYEVEWTWPTNAQANFNLVAILTDDQGRTYTPELGGSGGGSGGGGANADGTPLPNASTAHFNQNYDATIITDQPEALNLRLELLVEMTEAGSAGMSMGGGSGGGSGGGGGGGGSAPADAAPMPTLDPAEFEDIGPFVFEFTVPFNPGRVMETPQTDAVNAVAMTLQKAVVTPSLARFELCFVQPPYTSDVNFPAEWMPLISIAVDGQETAFTDQLPIKSAASGGDTTCYAYNLLEGMGDLQGEWTFAVNELVLPGSQDSAAVVAQLQAAGIDAELFDGGGYGVGGMPEGMTHEEMSRLMDDIVRQNWETYPGPWVFTFTLD